MVLGLGEGVVVHGLAGTQALTPPRLLPSLATLLALTLGLLIWTDDADARLEDGQYFAEESAYASVAFDAFDSWLTPAAVQPSYPGGSLGGLFNRPGLIGGFAAGFLGSGVIGLLFGHGVIGELSGVVSILGLLFQLALIVMLARLIWIWWRDDKADAAANLSPRQLADAYGPTRREPLPDIDQSADAAAAPGAAAPDALTKSEHPHS
jgi:hypothetical protein